ncbi:multicopper oxidase family protein [Paenarthrobacter sp. NPDC092416]|uniref:multicopper oxidase family protein n=1 Tax=Paenarthrobacter sp. NPDC092416 TaxID=3364386 RepID=UPI0038223651
MNTSQLLAVDLVLAILAAGAWIAAAWLAAMVPVHDTEILNGSERSELLNRSEGSTGSGASSGSKGSAFSDASAGESPAVGSLRRLDLALLAMVVALAATAGRYALLPALVAGSWWFASERATISMPLTAIPAVGAAMAGVPYLLRRRNTGFTRPEVRRPERVAQSTDVHAPSGRHTREWAVLGMVAAAASAVGSLAVIFVLGPFPALWTIAVLLFLIGGAVLLAKLVVFPRPARRTPDPSPATPTGSIPVSSASSTSVVSVGAVTGFAGPVRRRRPTTAAAVAGLMACTVLGSGTFAWLGSRAADGAVITAVGHHNGAITATVANPTPVTSLVGNVPANAVVRHYELTARVEQVTLPSGQSVEAWTFGSVPGPAIEAQLGEVVEVELKNRDIVPGVTLHWHGYDVPNAMDGVAGATQDAVLPGQSMTYRFVAAQSGTYWYHTHQDSAEGVRKGLYGTFVVHDPTMPRADADIVVAGHDLSGLGMLGSSDRSSEHAVVPGSTVRLRLINTDSLPQRYLFGGTSFKVVAVDGTEVNEPEDVSGKLLRLGAGGRMDVSFTMPDAAVTLRSDAATSAVVALAPPGSAASLPDRPPAAVFATTPELDLLTYGKPTAAASSQHPVTREEVVVLDRQFRFVDGVPRYAFTVNGAAYPLVPAIEVAEGDTVKVTIVNRTAEPHPMHPHGHHVLVLSRNGVAPSGSPLVLDTVDVLPGEVWEVLLHANNPGIWMDHCHNLDHAAEGMMMLLKYEGVSSPFVHGGHSHNRPE